MFSIGQDVICGNKGVCSVEDITTLDISGVDKAKKYYILKPRYVSASTVYVPVDTADASMRAIITKADAEELIHSMADLPLLDIQNEKMLEQDYKACMKTNSCREWARMLKTIYVRRQKRLNAGRKETAVDGKYAKLAGDNLYGELAVVLDMDRSDVCDMFTKQLEGIGVV